MERDDLNTAGDEVGQAGRGGGRAEGVAGDKLPAAVLAGVLGAVSHQLLVLGQVAADSAEENDEDNTYK